MLRGFTKVHRYRTDSLSDLIGQIDPANPILFKKLIIY